jgi:hypothetical protein
MYIYMYIFIDTHMFSKTSPYQKLIYRDVFVKKTTNILLGDWKTQIVAPTGSPFFLGNMNTPGSNWLPPFTTG